MTLEELKLRGMRAMIIEWEAQLRNKYKYSEDQNTTWDEVREMYFQIRNEYLVIDLLSDEID